MSTRARRLLFWTPRILGIMYAVFLSLFAFDVFTEGTPLGQTLIALAMHLIPTGVVVLMLVISWRWEWVGSVLCFFFGVFYIVMAWGRFPWAAYVAISGPCFVMGVLFALNWRHRAELRGARSE